MEKAKEKYDFKAFGLAIKAARKAKGYLRNALADDLNIAPSYTTYPLYGMERQAHEFQETNGASQILCDRGRTEFD